MATVKVKAPIGYHFMIRESDNDFYLMGTTGRYVKHEAGGYNSALSIDIEVRGSHAAPATAQRTASATSSSNRVTTTRTTRTTPTPTPTRTTSSGSSSGGGSYGGGY
tara:strand:+ start:1171 stop:1491 length:321 start_codon:yes stop_codon:yes gene_type:complete